MLSAYIYYRPAASEDALAAYFAARLDLHRVDAEAPFPLRSDQWWVHLVDGDADWDEEAARIGITAAAMVLVVFAPSKHLRADVSQEANAALCTAVIDQLNDTPGLTGLLQHGDAQVLIERPPCGPTRIDTSLAEALGHHCDPMRSPGIIADLPDLD
ncbi:hypothetical protein LO763_20140 [Glycomyces sp. A-F 0318]|uniref:hypothetical protein n=1 Tax=Glycomyces amatae TaxID=2881355 RepID=UPI001E49833E|nr:hypothetical protein [Glycomyces amatae]MCD0445925.1 hypothetical protein [Glycomyces amatae]